MKRFPTSPSPSLPTPHQTIILLLIVFFGLMSAVPHAQAQAPHVRPVPGHVITAYDPPEQNWLPGHRGVDLAAGAGTPVRSSGPGTVHFAGSVAGTPTVSVRHDGGFRTTYQPVRPSVEAGWEVSRGEVIGELADDSHPGLHWGALRGQSDYFNPLDLLGRRPIVLKPVK